MKKIYLTLMLLISVASLFGQRFSNNNAATLNLTTLAASSYPLGTLVTVESTGAVYKIENVAPSSYNGGVADEKVVRATQGGKFAVLQPVAGYYYLSHAGLTAGNVVDFSILKSNRITFNRLNEWVAFKKEGVFVDGDYPLYNSPLYRLTLTDITNLKLKGFDRNTSKIRFVPSHRTHLTASQARDDLFSVTGDIAPVSTENISFEGGKHYLNFQTYDCNFDDQNTVTIDDQTFWYNHWSTLSNGDTILYDVDYDNWVQLTGGYLTISSFDSTTRVINFNEDIPLAVFNRASNDEDSHIGFQWPDETILQDSVYNSYGSLWSFTDSDNFTASSAITTNFTASNEDNPIRIKDCVFKNWTSAIVMSNGIGKIIAEGSYFNNHSGSLSVFNSGTDPDNSIAIEINSCKFDTTGTVITGGQNQAQQAEGIFAGNIYLAPNTSGIINKCDFKACYSTIRSFSSSLSGKNAPDDFLLTVSNSSFQNCNDAVFDYGMMGVKIVDCVIDTTNRISLGINSTIQDTEIKDGLVSIFYDGNIPNNRGRYNVNVKGTKFYGTSRFECTNNTTAFTDKTTVNFDNCLFEITEADEVTDYKINLSNVTDKFVLNIRDCEYFFDESLTGADLINPITSVQGDNTEGFLGGFGGSTENRATINIYNLKPLNKDERYFRSYNYFMSNIDLYANVLIEDSDVSKWFWFNSASASRGANTSQIKFKNSLYRGGYANVNLPKITFDKGLTSTSEVLSTVYMEDSRSGFLLGILENTYQDVLFIDGVTEEYVVNSADDELKNIWLYRNRAGDSSGFTNGRFSNGTAHASCFSSITIIPTENIDVQVFSGAGSDNTVNAVERNILNAADFTMNAGIRYVFKPKPLHPLGLTSDQVNKTITLFTGNGSSVQYVDDNAGTYDDSGTTYAWFPERMTITDGTNTTVVGLDGTVKSDWVNGFVHPSMSTYLLNFTTAPSTAIQISGLTQENPTGLGGWIMVDSY